MSKREYELDARDEADIKRLAGVKRAVAPSDVTSVRYSKALDAVILGFRSGIELRLPRKLLQGLESFLAGAAVLHRVEVISHDAIEWPDIDVAHYVPALFTGIFGNERWMSELGRQGGQKKSPRKSTTSRENGRKGGRPPKKNVAA